MKKLFFLLCFIAGLMSLNAQTIYYWRNDQNPPTDASWSSASPLYFWNGTLNVGEIPPGADIIQFDGTNGLVSTNDLTATNRFKINFYVGGTTTVSRTLNGTTTNVFNDYGGVSPLIQNWSGLLQTINFPFQIGNTSSLNYAYGMQIWAGDGDLNIGSTISAANVTGGTKELVLTAGAAKTLTLSGVISDGSGAIKLSKWGAGNLLISGNNTYTGATTVSDGTLKLGSSTALGSIVGSTTVNTGYTLDMNGITYTNAEPLTVRGTGYSSAGAVSNSSTTAATFPGLLTLAAASTITGGSGTIALSNTGTITGAYDLTLDGNSGGSIASIIGTSNGKLIKNGTGIWKLSKVNTYTGETQLNNGELWIETGGDINTASAMWLGNGAALSTTARLYLSSLTGGTTFARAININAGNSGTRIIGGKNTSGTNTFSGNIVRSSNQPLTIDVPNAGGILTISGTINGSGEIRKSGSGTLTISGTNNGTAPANFTGSSWNVEQGTMSFAFFGTNLNGKPIILGNTNDVGTAIYTGTGGLTQTVPISTNAGGGKFINTATGDLKITPGTQTQTIAGTLEIACNTTKYFDLAYILTGAGGVKVSSTGTGALILSRTNTYSGATTINSGTLTLGVTNAIPSGVIGVQSAVTINGGTLSTGAASAGFSCGTNAYPMGVLTVGASGGTIALAPTTATQNLYFANSSAATWGGGTLTITGWTGSIGSTGTNGKIYIANTTGTLTTPQLSKINFSGITGSVGAMLLSDGEVVPATTSLPAITSFSTANNNGTTTSGYVGTTVTVTGVNLSAINTLKVGGSAGTTISSFTKNATTITFVATAGLSGAIYVSDGTDSYTSSSSYADLGYITTAATDWNTASTWLGGAVPAASSNATIAHAITLNAAATNNITALTVNALSSLTFGSSGSITVSGTTTNSGSIIMTAGGTLTVGAAGTLANGTSTFTGGAGAVVFAGVGTLSGTISLNNLTLNGALTNPTTVTVNGSLQLNSGSSVSNAPTYGSSSTLFYNAGGTNAIGSEWTATTASGRGVPQHVTIGNGTNSTIDFSGNNSANNWYLLNGNLLISAGSTLKLPPTLVTNGLKFGGNLTNNGTLNTNGGAIWFVGSTTKTLSSSSNQTIDFLKLVSVADLKLSGSNFTINAAQLGLQFQSTGGLDLNGKTLSMKTGATIVLRTASGATTKTISSSTAGGILTTEGSCLFSTETSGGNLATTADVTVSLGGALTIGTANTLSIAGILKINTGGSVITNAPVFAAGATLNYNLNNNFSTKYNQALEWPATSGPTSVLLTTNSWVQMTGDRSLTGNLTVTSGALQATGALRTLTMSGTNQTITVSSTTGGAIYGTDNGVNNDLQLTVANGSTTTFTGDATSADDDDKKFLNISVNSGGTLVLARGILCKWGTFTVNGILKINANGYIQSNNTTNGAAASTNKAADYSGGGTLVYNNGGSYTSSDKEWPTTSSPANVTIQNSGTIVSLNNSKTISGTLTLTDGTLNTDANTLTIAGSIAAIAGVINTGVTGTLSFAGTSEQTLSSSVLTSGSVNNLSINAGSKLTTSGTIAATTIAILSNATGTGTLKDAGTLTSSSTTVQQYLSSARNWYMASPVTNALAPAGYTYYKYDEPGNNVGFSSPATAYWESVSVGTTLTPMVGYIAQVSAGTPTISFTGTTLNNGDKSIGLTRTAGKTKEGFNFVGNPYPSFLNIDNLASNANIEKSYWFRSYNGGYVFDTYNITSALSTGNSGLAVSNYIPPMQAFWVRVAAGKSTATLNLLNANRSHQNNINNKFRAPVITNTNQQVFRLQVSNGRNSDEAIVYFNPNASDSFDSYDSQKMSNNSAIIPEIYTQAGAEQLVINGMKEVVYDAEIPLGFTTGTANNFTLTTTELENFTSGTHLILLDKSTNPITETELSVGASYSFSSIITTPTLSRFSLMFRTSGVATGAAGKNTSNSRVFVTDNQIKIVAPVNTAYIIVNAVGQKMCEGKTTTTTTSISTVRDAGVFLVIVKDNGKVLTKRVILK